MHFLFPWLLAALWLDPDALVSKDPPKEANSFTRWLRNSWVTRWTKRFFGTAPFRLAAENRRGIAITILTLYAVWFVYITIGAVGASKGLVLLGLIALSGIVSGSQISFLSLSPIQLEAEKRLGSKGAARIMRVLESVSLLIVTLLLINVFVNNEVSQRSATEFKGWLVKFYPIGGILFFGEILAIAMFNRYALQIGSYLAVPVHYAMRVLWPVTKPIALLLDSLLGDENPFDPEHKLVVIWQILRDDPRTDISKVEGQMVVNALKLDDIPIAEKGEPIDPLSIVPMPKFLHGRPIATQEWVEMVDSSGKKWVFVTTEDGELYRAIDADALMRKVGKVQRNGGELDKINIARHWHSPVKSSDPTAKVGSQIEQWHVDAEDPDDEVVDHDLFVLWTNSDWQEYVKQLLTSRAAGSTDLPEFSGQNGGRVVTGDDIMGRLLRKIVRVSHE